MGKCTTWKGLETGSPLRFSSTFGTRELFDYSHIKLQSINKIEYFNESGLFVFYGQHPAFNWLHQVFIELAAAVPFVTWVPDAARLLACGLLLVLVYHYFFNQDH